MTNLPDRRTNEINLPSIQIRQSIPINIGTTEVKAEIISFQGFESKKEHIALLFDRETQHHSESTLVRLHSECLTGDVFQSTRCDCGDQLAEAIRILDKTGGVLLYLRQEGRGIGLYNKLDAYNLQDQGLDTYEANVGLGFHEDQRDYYEAAQMLEALQIQHVELITNNPQKISQLEAYGITVTTSRSTLLHSKPDNIRYLNAKRKIGHHKFLFN